MRRGLEKQSKGIEEKKRKQRKKAKQGNRGASVLGTQVEDSEQSLSDQLPVAITN